MYAEFPPDFPAARFIETVTFYLPVDCMMWRMERPCPNTTDQGILCEVVDHRRIVLAQCPLCAVETQMNDTPVEVVIAAQQAAIHLLACFEFSPEYQQRIAMSDILSSLNKSGRADEMKIANALKAHGATKERTNAGARWNGLRWRA
jgi:hypothetical protein